jgi:hypothetical protein
VSSRGFNWHQQTDALIEMTATLEERLGDLSTIEPKHLHQYTYRSSFTVRL